MKLKSIAIALLLAVALIVAIGCISTAKPEKSAQELVYENRAVVMTTNSQNAHWEIVYRIHDDELNVTCYVYKGGGYRSGISCIPDSQIYGEERYAQTN